jgi:uncharacterized protein (DUF3820 family)
MTDNSIMPWGKYAGEKLCNIPASYLIWLYENNKCYGEIKKYIEDNLDDLKNEQNNKA